MSRPSSKTQQSIYDNVTLIKPTPNASKEDLEAITEANTTAITLSNAAASAAEAGQHIRAIALHKKALAIKLRVYGEESVQAAVSFNSMGESYIKAGRLDDAEEVLQKALYVRDSKVWGGLEMGPREDAAATRDNLAQVLEARGRFDEARALRLKGAERGETMCGNVDVSLRFSLRFLPDGDFNVVGIGKQRWGANDLDSASRRAAPC